MSTLNFIHVNSKQRFNKVSVRLLLLNLSSILKSVCFIYLRKLYVCYTHARMEGWIF